MSFEQRLTPFAVYHALPFVPTPKRSATPEARFRAAARLQAAHEQTGGFVQQLASPGRARLLRIHEERGRLQQARRWHARTGSSQRAAAPASPAAAGAASSPSGAPMPRQVCSVLELSICFSESAARRLLVVLILSARPPVPKRRRIHLWTVPRPPQCQWIRRVMGGYAAPTHARPHANVLRRHDCDLVSAASIEAEQRELNAPTASNKAAQGAQSSAAPGLRRTESCVPQATRE